MESRIHNVVSIYLNCLSETCNKQIAADECFDMSERRHLKLNAHNVKIHGQHLSETQGLSRNRDGKY